MRRPDLTERLLALVVPRTPVASAMHADLEEQYVEEVARLGAVVARVRHTSRVLAVVLHFLVARLRGNLNNGSAGSGAAKDNRAGLAVALWFDLRRAVRTLRHKPVSTCIAITTMALTIGAACVVFAIADYALLRPLPYPAADRLAYLWSENARTGNGGPDLRREALESVRAHGEMFEQVEALVTESRLVTGIGEPEELDVALVTPGLLPMFGGEPFRGRGFAEDDGTRPVALVSFTVWTDRLGASDDAVGREIVLDDVTHTVIGVLPQWFRYPSSSVAAWIPMPAGAHPARVTPVVRLTTDARASVVDARLEATSATLQEAGLLSEGWRLSLWSLQAQREFFARSAKDALQILLAAVGLVLVIASVNLAGLRLTDFLGRSRELAIATALGARRARLLRQMVFESLMAAIVGGLFGAVLARVAINLIVRSAPASLGFILRAQAVAVDGRVLGAVLAVSLISGLLAGLVPALHASRRAATSGLVATFASTTTSNSRRPLRAGLVVVEVAMATSLLFGSGLLIKSFLTLNSVDPGFEIDGIVVTEVTVGAGRYPSMAEKLELLGRLEATIAAVPGVDASAVAYGAPPRTLRRRFVRFSAAEGSDIAGDEDIGYDTGQGRFASVVHTTDRYLEVLGLVPISGRGFRPTDSSEAIIINESLAAELWPQGNAIGRRISLARGGSLVTVVGVVADIRHSGFDESADQMEMYRPLPALDSGNVFQLLVRTTRRSDTLGAEVQTAIRALDRELPIGKVSTMRLRYGDGVALQRFSTSLMVGLAIVGTLLAALGLYGVIAYDVRSTTREIGIRIALGATPRRVYRRVVGRGLGLAAAGVVVGGVVSFWLARLLENLLFGISSQDPGVFAAIAAGALALALATSSVPARRATRIDIMEILRRE